jgi:UDP-GlcNAc3NAcA epimerase
VKITTIIGARPQFIKAAAVSTALEGAGIRETLIHTGQHYDAEMSQVFFDELGIREPEFNLGIGSGPHGEQTGRMLTAIERVLMGSRPDCVLVYGDTNSTLAGGLAAAKLQIPLAHVEAGLRSFNRIMPEETNRVLVDHISEFLFAPTKVSVENLRHEGCSESHIHHVGDVMYDATLHFMKFAEELDHSSTAIELKNKDYVLATIHRAENTDDPGRLDVILNGLQIAAANQPVVFPMHPRTGTAIERYGLANRLEGIMTISPVGYLDMLMLERDANLIVTDSGGVQKEAYFVGSPCLTIRTETEWLETLEGGWNRLHTPDTAHGIAHAIEDAQARAPALQVTRGDIHPFGNGTAGLTIAETLKESLS